MQSTKEIHSPTLLPRTLNTHQGKVTTEKSGHNTLYLFLKRRFCGTEKTEHS